MTSTSSLAPNPPRAFGALLRRRRTERGLSQLELSHACRISTRHLSFLEAGRARPSRDMILHLAEGLLLSFAARNELLHAGGFAPAYTASPLESEALAPFLEALRETMTRHSPYPALICDRRWRLLEANPSALFLFGQLQSGRSEMNLIRLLTDAPDAADRVANLPDVLAELSARIRLEMLSAGSDDELEDLARRLETAQARHPRPPASLRSPLTPLILNTPSGQLSLMSLIAHFGTGEDVTIRDLRLELFFPTDEASREAFQAFSGQSDHPMNP